MSYMYLTLRLSYVLYGIFLVPVLGSLYFGFTLDTIVYEVYGEIKNDKTLLRNHTPFGTEIRPADGEYANYDGTTYFNGKLIVYWKESSPNNLYLFTSKLGAFMDYVNPQRNIYSSHHPAHLKIDKEKTTLYLDSRNTEDEEKGSRIIYLNNHFYLDYYPQNRQSHDSPYVETSSRIKL